MIEWRFPQRRGQTEVVLIEGSSFPKGRRVAVVAARFNEAVTEPLLAGAVRRLRERGIAEADIDVAHVPGAFEIPGVAKRMALTGRYGAIVCLGALIRGETPHFDYIAKACALGIGEVSLSTGVPAAFGVLTCDTEEQALARVGGEMGHKGEEAADAALEMAALYAAIGPATLKPGT